MQRACLCVASLTCLPTQVGTYRLTTGTVLTDCIHPSHPRQFDAGIQTYAYARTDRLDRPLVESTIRGNSPRSSIYSFFPFAPLPARFAMDDAGLQLVYGTNNEKDTDTLA